MEKNKGGRPRLNKIRLTVYLPRHLYTWLIHRAGKTGKSWSETVEDILTKTKGRDA